jgi:DNA-binding CsgD family transcriptional regulator
LYKSFGSWRDKVIEVTVMAQDYQLSKREREVIGLLLQGQSNKLIALSLGISERTVEFHLTNIYAKLQVSSRIELILKLVNSKSDAETGILRKSTVDKSVEKVENRGSPNSRMYWVRFFIDAISTIDKESIMKNLMTSPSAFLPAAMSLCAIATIVIFIAFNGTAPQADEGAAAHIWQLLMAAQIPIILFFAMKWLPRSPRQAASILALQVGLALAAMAPVYLLHW